MSSISITGINARFFWDLGSATRPISMRSLSSMARVWVEDWLSMVIFMWGYCSIYPFK